MNRYKRMVDLYFTDDGDFVLDENTGDLEDTLLYQYRGFVQRLLTRTMSQKGEWQQQKDVGAGISDFLGKRNTAELGERIRSRLYSELIKENLVAPADLNILVFPTGDTSVGIVLRIRPPGTQVKIQLTFSYDMRENRVIPRNI